MNGAVSQGDEAAGFGHDQSSGNLQGSVDKEEDRKAKLRLRNRDAQRRLRARKRAAAEEVAKTLEEVEEAINREEDVYDKLEVHNYVLEKVVAVREEFIAAVQHLQQLDVVVRSNEAASREPHPREVEELTRMAPADFAAQWQAWHRAVKARFEQGEASGWPQPAAQEMEQHIAYLVAIFQALTLTAPDNVLALYATASEQTVSVAQNLPRWQHIAASLGVGEGQMGELQVVYETYLQRMSWLIASRDKAYTHMDKVSCPSPTQLACGRLVFRGNGPPVPHSASSPLHTHRDSDSPSLMHLASCSGELQQSVEDVSTTYTTEYHVINDLLDSLFAIFTARQISRIIAMSDPLYPDYLQILCCLINGSLSRRQLPPTSQQQQQQEEQGVNDGWQEGPSPGTMAHAWTRSWQQHGSTPSSELARPQQAHHEAGREGRGQGVASPPESMEEDMQQGLR